MRKISLNLHRWVGLFAAIFLFLEGVTGGVLAWGPEIIRAFNPPGPRVDAPVTRVPPSSGALPLSELAATLEKGRPGFRVRTIRFSAQESLAWSAGMQSQTLASLTVWFDPHTGEILGERVRQLRLVWLERTVQIAGRLHGNIVGGVALFLLACSGLILWWPRKIFVPGRPASIVRTNFDLHNAIGFYSSLFLALFSATAMVMAFSRPAIAVISVVTRTPLSSDAQRPASPKGPAPLQAGPGRKAGNAVRLDFDQALEAAARARPGVRFTGTQLANEAGWATIFSYRSPGSASSRDEMVLVNRRTGEVQELPNPKDYTLAERIVRVWVRGIHTGEIFGRPSRWIAGFFSFMLAALAASGPAIWWLRRRADQLLNRNNATSPSRKT